MPVEHGSLGSGFIRPSKRMNLRDGLRSRMHELSRVASVFKMPRRLEGAFGGGFVRRNRTPTMPRLS